MKKYHSTDCCSLKIDNISVSDKYGLLWMVVLDRVDADEIEVVREQKVSPIIFDPFCVSANFPCI